MIENKLIVKISRQQMCAKCNCELFFLGYKTINLCINTTCSSELFSVCLECAVFHPVWKIPVVANRRNRKCRGDGSHFPQLINVFV